jgi:hypothetical protein
MHRCTSAGAQGDRYKICNNRLLICSPMTNSFDKLAASCAGVMYGYESKRDLVLVVLCGGDASRRWRDATRLRCSELHGADPASILFVEFDPVSVRLSMLHLRWSPRLWSYCYAGATELSEAMTAALGLRTPNWQHALASLARQATLATRGAVSG